MNCVGYFLICLFASANAIKPIDRNFINTFGVETFDDVKYRLPNNTKPNSYYVILDTNVDQNNFTFTGTVEITLEVLEATTTITLHARQLEVTQAKLKPLSGPSVEVKGINHNDTTEFLTITAAETLTKGTIYTLTLEYVGTLREDRGGFYRSSYVNAKGETRWLASTQFESTDARHGFPCYDEPALKATFIIEIKHGKTYNAISNMPLKGEPKAGNDNKVTTTFETTEMMSTYLVAFIVSDFEFTANNSSTTSIKHRVYAQPDLVTQTAHALAEGIALLDALAKYLQVPFKLTKMDQAAIPDFRAGAMENWGLVTYRPEMLLFDANSHAVTRQLSITTTIAHEFGHQWFGDLVTPKWWTYIWLNEGFATVSEPIAVNAIHPEMNIWTYFVSSKVQPVLRVDAKSNSRPMTYYTEDPTSIANLFDNIVYAKAGSVIRMFMHALGEETFKKGLMNYLTKNALKAVDENDLFENLDAAAKEDKSLPTTVNVKDLFGSWSNQAGFPVLKVIRNYTTGSIQLTQEKYDDIYDSNATSTVTWWLPYNFASASQPEFNSTKPSGWLQQGQKDVVIESKENNTEWKTSDWLVFNRQQTGYYRVWYDEENYNLLNKELNEGNLENINAINRAQILDDLHDFVRTGRLSSKILCKTMNYLPKEKEYAPWSAAKRAINDWNQHLQASEKLANFRRVVKTLVEPFYERVKLEEGEKDQLLDKLSRNMAVDLACKFGVDKCLDETYAKFKDYIADKQVLPNIRGVVIGNGIRKATDEEIQKLWENFLKNKSLDERKEIIASLGNIPRDSTLETYLKKTIEDFETTVTTDERQSIVKTIIGSGQQGVSKSIKFLAENLAKVTEKVGKVLELLETIAQNVRTAAQSTEFSNLLGLAKNQSVITDATETRLNGIVSSTMDWQTKGLKTFESDFFTDTCAGNGAAKMAAYPALILILGCLIRWSWM